MYISSRRTNIYIQLGEPEEPLRRPNPMAALKKKVYIYIYTQVSICPAATILKCDCAIVCGKAAEFTAIDRENLGIHEPLGKPTNISHLQVLPKHRQAITLHTY